jgi:hypothetical protein
MAVINHVIHTTTGEQWAMVIISAWKTSYTKGDVYLEALGASGLWDPF